MAQYAIARLIFMIKIFSCNIHCLYFTRIKSLKCNDQHFAFSGFYHGATKTCVSMFLYKILSCDGKKESVMNQLHTLHIGEWLLNKSIFWELKKLLFISLFDIVLSFRDDRILSIKYFLSCNPLFNWI